MISWLKKHGVKINVASYTALIIFGANFLMDHGELKSDVKHLNYSLEQCVNGD